MVNLFKLTRLLLVLGVCTYLIRWYFHHKVNLEPYRKDGWFGRKAIKGGTIPLDDLTIRPFTVNISESKLTDLQRRLQRARFVDHISGTSFNFGFSSVVLKRVVKYWLSSDYSWRAEEAKLNAFPQYRTQIEGLQMHFVHVRPENASVTSIPLLLIHSFPGSFYEFYKIIPQLMAKGVAGDEEENVSPTFEIVVPSIPGFAFSEGPHQRGFNATAAARVFLKLMRRLGHRKFIVHGGDVGNIIARTMAVLYPQHLLAIHLVGNMDILTTVTSPYQMLKIAFYSYLPQVFYFFESTWEYSKLNPLGEKFLTLFTETGYIHLQATKPDTIASSLVDSPVGLAAYILDKFASLGALGNVNRKDGGLVEKFDLDELLTNVMLYWHSSSGIAASLRFWRENFVENTDLLTIILSQKINVLAGTVDTPHHLIRSPEKMVAKSYTKLVQQTKLQRGSHFTAFENPDLICADLLSFLGKIDLPLPPSSLKTSKQIKQLKDEV